MRKKLNFEDTACIDESPNSFLIILVHNSLHRVDNWFEQEWKVEFDLIQIRTFEDQTLLVS